MICSGVIRDGVCRNHQRRRHGADTGWTGYASDSYGNLRPMPKAVRSENWLKRYRFTQASRDVVLFKMLERVKVILDYTQEVQAHEVGFERVTKLKFVADHPNHGNKNLNLHEYITEMAEAAAAEIVVAQYLEFKNFKPTLNTFKSEADVGARFEVKWTKYRDGHLSIGQTDRVEDVAILVTGKSPVYEIAGWLPIKMARRPKYFHAGYGVHWVSQNNLFPIQDLKRSIYGAS